MQLHSTITKTEWKYALLYSAFIPVIDLVNDSQRFGSIRGRMILQKWSYTFLFNLGVWVFNSIIMKKFEGSDERWVVPKKVGLWILCNGLMLLFLIVMVEVLLLNSIPFAPVKGYYLYIIFRGFVGIGVIYIIQSALRSSSRAYATSMQNQMLKTENIRSQFEVLKHQISPHFLFNSLSTLHSMVRLHSPNTEEYVLKLSEIYRHLLVKKELDAVPLKEELGFVNDYIYMLQSRFTKMLYVDIEIPDNLMHMKIPTFCLQVLVENCMKHNIATQEKPLHIRLFSGSPDTITVENNVQPKLTKPEKSGFGLKNLEQRYILLGCPDCYVIHSDEKTFRVTLKLLDA